jgi:sugar phosphate permease
MKRGTSPLTTLQWAVLGLLFLSTVVNYLDRQALSVLKESLHEDLGLTNTDYGYVTGVFMVTYSVAQVGLGIWIDRVGVRWGLGLSVLVWSLAAMLHALVRGPWSLGAMRVLMALGEGANWPAGGKAVGRWLPPYLQRHLGFTLGDVACFAWIPYLTADAGKILGGLASDRLLRGGASPSVARKGVMLLGAACMTAGMFVAQSHDATTAVALASTATFGFGFWSSNTLALHADCFPSQLLASAIGLTGMTAALGGAAFTSSVGLIVDRFGYDYAFLAAGLAPLLACVVLVFGVGRVPQVPTAATPEEKSS